MPQYGDHFARFNLDRLKYEVAAEVAPFAAGARDERSFQEAVDRVKFEVAREIGVPLREGYNGDLTTRQAGAVGGRIGGKIGGHMVRRMIQFAEQQLAGRQPTRW